MDEDLRNRVARLERSRHRQRVFAAAMTLGFVMTLSLFTALGLAGANEPPAETIRARSVDIINEDGTVVLHLGVRSSGAGGLWITNAEGKRVLVLNQSPDGSGKISVRDAGGREAASVIVLDGDGRFESN